MSSTAIERLNAAVAAVAPIHGCALLTPGAAVDPSWHVVSNATTTPATPVRIDYRPEATAGQISQGDSVATTFDLTVNVRRPRPLWSIRGDVQALSVGQFSNVWNDLSAPVSGGPPRKYLTDYGTNAGTIFVYDHVIYVVQGTAAQVKAGQISLTACFSQDNPTYLVHPPWDTSINIPGDEPVS